MQQQVLCGGECSAAADWAPAWHAPLASWETAHDGSSAGVLAVHVRGLAGVPDPWLVPGPALAVGGHLEGLHVFLSPCTFQVDKSIQLRKLTVAEINTLLLRGLTSMHVQDFATFHGKCIFQNNPAWISNPFKIQGPSLWNMNFKTAMVKACSSTRILRYPRLNKQ